jgi:hypothetical protein
MAVPVTRGELRQQVSRLERKIGAVDRKLDLWGGAVADRFTRIEKRMDAFEKRFDGLEKRLHADLARFAKAIGESVAQAITIVDEKYKDLPGRVSKLERRATQRRPR